MKHTLDELQQWQALPLSVKVRMTQARIRDWVNEFGEDGVYISFSGGKDSTVLLDIARKMYPSLPAVFVDTGLEFPEIREFVKTFENVEWLKPRMNFKEVIFRYGYPFISKEVSEAVQGARIYLERLKNSDGGGVLHNTNTSMTKLLERADIESQTNRSRGGRQKIQKSQRTC